MVQVRKILLILIAMVTMVADNVDNVSKDRQAKVTVLSSGKNKVLKIPYTKMALLGYQ
ncbi:MAG: hypothetical protein J7577_06730 [Sphingobacteriaceae bacterium]|nr:hypothetical protein [Sphingobacteriaceae bacterium]